jgi:phosphosulfolactate synthase
MAASGRRTCPAGGCRASSTARAHRTVSLFDSSGAVRGELVDAILRAVGQETVIFEAPQRAQQAWLLRRVGPDVSLGTSAPMT